ncbi:MAG: Alternative cytochrome c oxidase subunit 2 [Verrucomicrobiota bacterium]|jgi:cytochrome c oxidase subunit 2
MDIKNILGLPMLGSKHGADVDLLIILVHYLMVALFVGWGLYFLYCLWRFRQSRQPKADHKGVTSHASNYLEVAVAIVEVVLLVGFAVPLWAKVVDDLPSEDKNPLHVRITGQQYNWMARYPGDDRKFGKQDVELVSADNPLGLHQKVDRLKEQDVDGKDDVNIAGGGEIAIPLNRDVIAHITSMDVIHSFKVPPLRVTQDAIPGIRIPTHFMATTLPPEGKVYQINCAQLCGTGHSNMKGTLRVLPEKEFADWLKSKAGAVQSFE